jgi:signal transduction histidine kinase
MDLQIAMISLFSLIALLLILAILFLTGNYYIHSILVPLSEIVEKAKKISGGSYGIQISKRYNDEIGELTDTINEMSLRLNENEKVQTEFISSLSHELRTPLTAINGWSETILGDDNLDPNTRRGVRIIQRESDRLTGMVMDLLDFTRIQDGRMNLNMETVDLRSEFEDTVFMYGSRLSQEGIELVYLENDQEIPEISCDPKRMRQVFLNILDNAAKHGGEGKRIETEISCDNGYIRVKIRDFGPGIPADELSLVKKKFYKGSSKARGSGIGLAVCDEIVQMHGGTLTLENAPGGGTVALVDLPVTE